MTPTRSPSAVVALCGCASPPGSIVVLADHQEGIVPNSTSDDDRIELTPISRPDPAVRDRRRRRRTWIVGGVALVVVAGGITALVVHANQDHTPVKHTAVLPTSFGAYTEAKPGDTEWAGLSDVNTDITKGSVQLTYRAADGKAAKIAVSMDPSASQLARTSDDVIAGIFSTSAVPGQSKTYPAGKLGGTFECGEVTVGNGVVTYCIWQTEAARVTLVPVLNHYAVVSKDAPADLRDFLDALKIQPK